jgi:hypothetical protein
MVYLIYNNLNNFLFFKIKFQTLWKKFENKYLFIEKIMKKFGLIVWVDK